MKWTNTKIFYGVETWKKTLKCLSKIKFLHKLENNIPAFEKYVDEMQYAFKEMKNDIVTILIVMLIKGFSLACYYAIPFFIFYAIGVRCFNDNTYVYEIFC